MKIIYDLNRCLACKSCELACAVSKSKSKNLFDAIKETPVAKPRIRILSSGGKVYSIRCQQCENPECVDACIAGALKFNEQKKLILHNVKKCVGCLMCIMVCPYGAIWQNNETKIPIRCIACRAKKGPPCVLACPTNAMFFLEE